jgi:hypothetical protein
MKTRMRRARGLPRISIASFLCLLGVYGAALPAHADDWLPVTPDELNMTAEPKAPGAPAIILYRQVDRDDASYHERVYVRIKVLTEEGLKQANVQIPFLKDYESVRDVQGRTIRPDGSIVAFDGKTYEQPYFASRSANVWIATFTMPAVEVGSIIEVRYLHRLRSFWIYENDPAIFWRKFAKDHSAGIDRFLWGSSMAKAPAQVVQPGDSPEVKLRKIYARTQQIENFSYERSKTEQEADRENPRDIHHAEDVWSHGYGNYLQITLLFLGLARAAGIEAYPVSISNRDSYFFDRRLMDAGQLNSTIVLVKLDGKELYLAPGVPCAPFGLLPWEQTGVKGLVLDKDGGRWIDTPFPAPSVSTVQRKATLHLDEAGSLEGKVVVTYTGLEALSRRLRERNEDGQARTQFLENDLKRAVPAGSDVTLTNEPDWRTSDPQLVAEYDLKVPGWMSSAGRYHLFAVGLFGAEEKHEFEPAERNYPIYFEFAFDHQDDVAIELPPGWRPSSTPQPQRSDFGALAYTVAVDSANGTLQIRRDLMQNSLIFPRDRYDVLSDFFQKVRTGDEEQVVLSPETAAATH